MEYKCGKLTGRLEEIVKILERRSVDLGFVQETRFKGKPVRMIKVAPRVEKTGVFQRRLKFCKSDLFCELNNGKHYFLLWMKETAFFPCFYHGIIFSSAELFDCTVKFKFYLNIFLNINTNQTSKEQYSN